MTMMWLLCATLPLRSAHNAPFPRTCASSADMNSSDIFEAREHAIPTGLEEAVEDLSGNLHALVRRMRHPISKFFSSLLRADGNNVLFTEQECRDFTDVRTMWH